MEGARAGCVLSVDVLLVLGGLSCECLRLSPVPPVRTSSLAVEDEVIRHRLPNTVFMHSVTVLSRSGPCAYP